MNESMTANTIPDHLLEDIKQAISNKQFGSVEIYIEAGKIVQITERTIKKTTTKFNSAIKRSGLRK
jgi:hypothetical protein